MRACSALDVSKIEKWKYESGIKGSVDILGRVLKEKFGVVRCSKIESCWIVVLLYQQGRFTLVLYSF